MSLNSSIIAKYDYVAFYFALHSSVAFLFARLFVSVLDSYPSTLSQSYFPQQKMSDICQLHFLKQVTSLLEFFLHDPVGTAYSLHLL